MLEHSLRAQWGDVCHGYCAVQVASNMALEFQFHNLKHTVACVSACYRSVSVGDYLTMLSVAEITQRSSR